MSDRNKQDRPGRGRPRNEVRAVRAKRRAGRAAALIGDLARKENRDCVYRHRARLRAEVLVYVLRRQLNDERCFDEDLFRACSTTLLSSTPISATKPRSGALVSSMVRKAMRRAGLPRGDSEFKEFFAAAIETIWTGIESVSSGETMWQERFGMRLRDRLVNVATASRREIRRIAAMGSFEQLPPSVLLAYERDASAEMGDAEEDERMLALAVAALRRALDRLPHPSLRLVYSVDDVGRMIPTRDAARQLGCDRRTVTNLRARARELLRRDPMLREEIQKMGFKVRQESS